MNHAAPAMPQASSDYAMAKRAEKQAWAEEIGVDAGFIDGLVDAFYANIAADPLLGRIFQRHVTDWPRHFEHWLHLFYQTLRESHASAAAAALVGGRARMIAHSLLTAIETRRDGPSVGRTGKDLPHV